jgi:regulatory protein
VPLRRPVAPPPNIRTAALRLLGRRDYTTAELRRKLIERGCAAEAVDAALQRLAADGLLDDRRAAAAHVRSGIAVKGRGRRRIRQELQQRGIAASTITELTNNVAPEDEEAAIERILTRKRVPPSLSPADHQRIFQQLMRRGFPSETIADVLRKRRART